MGFRTSFRRQSCQTEKPSKYRNTFNWPTDFLGKSPLVSIAYRPTWPLPRRFAAPSAVGTVDAIHHRQMLFQKHWVFRYQYLSSMQYLLKMNGPDDQNQLLG
ncbi:hypothetical protein B5X24_HaOG207115 [Helicoverpa armigera]|uniref:Uncharacterized protein n=1 Tax=Helicoverpa armigera TaxID=29058 RepID=A0A2W1BKP8_HELAM|nr:hypothetical protein B5X24_HaOG207115 [Helicoverpa armigera]